MLTAQSPFSGCDEDELFWSICNERPSIPKYLSQDSIDILLCLLEKDAGKRLPGHEVQNHPFFSKVKEDSQNYCLNKPEISEYQTFYSDTSQLSTEHSDLDQSSIINKTLMHPSSSGMTSTPIKERDSVSQYVSGLIRHKNPRG
ncbi:hypothetical protein KQX54_013898 [Cotesia glomerata]|uniref:Uncharacterized protein n=1 Tax=Cotesia glomerata TaxID=32391 RepID=A0AAV7IDH5_COTGL|nr:hypothetical protein KQX54_013898 [Cotesia glomerata]